MCTDPVLLCLDEPAAGLNARESAELNALLKFIRAEHAISILLIEHDMSVVMEISDHIVVLDYGVKIADGTPEAIRNDPEGDRGLSRRRGRRGREGRGGGRAMTEPLLAVRGVKTFYGNIMALKGVDLDVNDGEIVTLIGANGAGKSTLMMTIFGNPRASEGSIVFDGRDITQMPSHEIARLRIAQSPEGRRIFPRMTRAGKPADGRDRRRPRAFRRGRQDASARCSRCSSERMRQRGGTLSGGEQQMLAIARALMSRPRLLLLDEPSLGLAPMLAQQIFRAIRELNSRDRLTVFLVEQNAFHALKLAHRGYVIVNGEITLSGSGRELLERPEVRAAYLEGGRREADRRLDKPRRRR